MEWYRQVQFVVRRAMPPDLADAFGTTVNGMWADPEPSSPASVEEAHGKGKRTLFSVPMIALTPKVYEEPGDGVPARRGLSRTSTAGPRSAVGTTGSRSPSTPRASTATRSAPT